MQEKLLKKIITDYAGNSGEKLVDLLFKKQNVNEFLIAKKMNLTINQTRNMLYRLADEGLVEFLRKKDKKKGGWYTYFWTMQIEKGLLKYKDKILHELEKLKSDLGVRKKERFFYCKNCQIEYTEESALLNDYTCPECGEILEMRSPETAITQIEHEMKKLNSVLAQINVELQEVDKKKEKTKAKRMLEEQRQKDLERKKRKREREKLKNKELKSHPIKKSLRKKPKQKNKGKKRK